MELTAASGSAKRALTSLTLRQRYDVVQELSRGDKQVDIAKTIDDVDAALLEWFRNTGHGQPGVSGAVPQEKAKQLGIALGFGEDLEKLDINWVNRFKARHSIVAKILHGKAAVVAPEAVENWRNNTLAAIQREYRLEDIYNADEMGLFWRLLPDRTLDFRKQNCSGGKKAKDRVTVLVGSNAMGAKLPLLVIGKSKFLRCFRGKNIEYLANKKAWMNGEIFTQYVTKLDRRMKRDNRKIALIVDNCTAHPTDIQGLQAVKLFFLPPNTTAKLQPMDAGIIRNLQYHYRIDFIKKKIDSIDNNQEFSLTIFEAICMLNRAWEKVKESTIQNCYRHTGYRQVYHSHHKKLPEFQLVHTVTAEKFLHAIGILLFCVLVRMTFNCFLAERLRIDLV